MFRPASMRRMPQIAHVDVNCFYATAERAFDPSLKGKPVIVLSNNDGFAVTRSPEAKASGILMGEPWFKLAPGEGMGPRRPRLNGQPGQFPAPPFVGYHEAAVMNLTDPFLD